MSDTREKNAVVDLERARARLRSRGKASAEELHAELESIRELLDRGLTSDARARLNALMSKAANQPAVLAEARCVLSIALDMLGQYRDSLAAVDMYEPLDARAKLDPSLGHQTNRSISIAYTYNGDHPKAIGLA